jgi:hypothetical protein
MPKEIKTTIAVDGEAAFKRAINDATTSLRNMGTQLTLAQAEFKKDGDAMKLMETRSKALKGEIGQQEEIVKALEKAVSDSAKAYGENSDKTEKWQAELNRAKAKLANLQNELTLNEQGLDRNGKAFDDSSQKAADYQATLQTIGKNVSFQTISEGIKGVTGTIEGAIKKVFNFAKAIRETFADAGEWADTLMTDATKYGMDVETLQRWQNAADLIDTPVETIITARDKLSKKMKSGWKNGDLDMWQVLGIDLRDAETGKARDKMDIMWDLGETLLHISELQEKGSTNYDAEALSMEVFGKSWRDLLPLFKAGREEWEKTVAEQDVVSEQRVKALGELDDANQALENSWDVTKYSFLAELAPTVTEVTEAVTEMLHAFNEWMDTDEGKKAMNDLSEAIKELFSGLKDVKFKDAIDTVQKAIEGIKTALSWLDEHKNDVFTALEVIAGGFALLKVADLAINIGKIVSGFQTLWAGAKNPLPSMPGADNTTPTTDATPTTGTPKTDNAPTAETPKTGDTPTTDTTATDAAAGGGIIQTIKTWIQGGKNAINQKALDLSAWANSFNMTNAGFVSDWFFHNTETGRSVNPEYGGSFSFENLWNGFWKSVNERLEENEEFNKAMDEGEQWSVLVPGSKEKYDKKQAEKEKNAEARAWYQENVQQETTLTPEEWENMNAFERDLYMKTHPIPTQKEINAAYDSAHTYWTAGTPAAEPEPVEKTPREVLAELGTQMTDAQRNAVEEWWDAFRADVMGDEWYDAFDRMEEALDENKELHDAFDQAFDALQAEDEDFSYLDQENLLNDAVSQMKVNTESGKSIADKIASADFKRFNGLPVEIQRAAQAGTAAGVSGIKVYMDGSAVGRLVAPYVSAIIANAVG